MRISDWSSDVCSSDLCRRSQTGSARLFPLDNQLLARPFQYQYCNPIWRHQTGPTSLFLLPEPVFRLLRSEEHTSELQPLMRTPYAVFCLKKKTFQHNPEDHTRDFTTYLFVPPVGVTAPSTYTWIDHQTSVPSQHT